MSTKRERLAKMIAANLDVLNLIETHLGCANCRGELIDGRCPTCQLDKFETSEDGKLRLKP